MEYHRSRPVSLKTHETYNERWLQAQIAEDPGLLGLGDLIVRASNDASRGQADWICC